MNKSIFYIFVLFTVIFIRCGKDTTEKTATEIKYTAYYFHPTARCEECLNLEAFLKELIETKYEDKGFNFSPLNIEDKENEHFRNKFELMFSSVVLFDKNSEKWRKLDSVWSYTHDKENFFRYTESEINNFINQN